MSLFNSWWHQLPSVLAFTYAMQIQISFCSNFMQFENPKNFTCICCDRTERMKILFFFVLFFFFEKVIFQTVFYTIHSMYFKKYLNNFKEISGFQPIFKFTIYYNIFFINYRVLKWQLQFIILQFSILVLQI